MLWVDKHRPLQLDKLRFHDELTEQLRRISDPSVVGDMSHLLFYGPSGAGKKTRVMALLREIYGPGVEKMKVEVRPFKFKSNTVELTFISSNYHIELNPSDVGPYRDREVAQEVIKEIAQSHAPLTASGGLFKVIVLNEVDKMSRDAQAALRRTMEKYTSACRFILICNNACKVIEPVRSRCVALRIPAPTKGDIKKVLQEVSKKENTALPEPLAERIAIASNRNLRRALLMVEACKVKQSPLTDDQAVEVADWERFIGIIATNVLEEQTPQRLLAVRGQMYELLAACIPADLIMQKLTIELLKKMDDSLKPEVLQHAAYYEHRLNLGSKPVFHIEAFVAKVMASYKKWSIEFLEMMDDM